MLWHTARAKGNLLQMQHTKLRSFRNKSAWKRKSEWANQMQQLPDEIYLWSNIQSLYICWQTICQVLREIWWGTWRRDTHNNEPNSLWWFCRWVQARRWDTDHRYLLSWGNKGLEKPNKAKLHLQKLYRCGIDCLWQQEQSGAWQWSTWG